MIEQRRLDVAGVSTQCLCAGVDGPPVVLLHGLGDSATSWRPLLERLSGGHRLYAPSLPGHGDTAKPPVDYSPQFLTAFVEAFMDAVGLPRATIVGASLGGLIAMRVALGRPSRVDALVLVDSAGLGRAINPMHALLALPAVGEFTVAWGKTPLGAWQRAIARAALLFRVPPDPSSGWFAEQRRMALMPGALEAVLAANRAVVGVTGQRYRVRSQLRALSMPTLVVWGAQDLVVPVAHARAAVRLLPNGNLVVLPGCGHAPHLERPDELAGSFREFLRDGARPSASPG